jgi:NTP pyrophosphatase (non-canonical NTP hydrolase)
MEIRELQRKAVEIVDALDRKFKIERDVQLSFTQMMEEVGELAKDINRPRLRGAQPDRKNIEGEFADVFIQLSKLASMAGVDMESAVLDKMEEIKKRHGI